MRFEHRELVMKISRSMEKRFNQGEGSLLSCCYLEMEDVEKRYNPHKGTNFANYAWRCLYYRCLKELFPKGRPVLIDNIPETVDGAGTEESVISNLTTELIWNIIEDQIKPMTPLQQTLIRARLNNPNVQHKEITKLIGCSIEAMQWTWNKFRKVMKPALKKQEIIESEEL